MNSPFDQEKTLRSPPPPSGRCRSTTAPFQAPAHGPGRRLGAKFIAQPGGRKTRGIWDVHTGFFYGKIWKNHGNNQLGFFEMGRNQPTKMGLD